MEHSLMAMVTPKTKKYLDMRNTEALLTRAPLKFDNLLRLAEKYKKNCSEVPTMNLTVSTNLVESQSTITAQISKIKELQKSSNQVQDLSKKLDNLYAVASLHFKRDKSIDKKTTLSKPAYRSSSGSRPVQNLDVEMTDVSTLEQSY